MRRCCIASILLSLFAATAVLAQQTQPSRARPAAPRTLKTPLPAETLRLLANELSGQMIYNNMVKVAGAPWIRTTRECTGTFYEAQTICDLAREYGIPSAHVEKHEAAGTFDYPREGEFWVLEPQKRLVARLEADPALIAAGSQTAEVSGELVYLPPQASELKQLLAAGPTDKYRGKLALMWSHPSADQAKALAAAGIQGVVAFNSRERYFDPDQVVYSSGPYGQSDSPAVGFTISWRQWSELLEDVQRGIKVVVRGKARVEKYPNKFDTVAGSIQGTEPDAKGVVLTAHLFDGYVKRGANDNVSGCVIQLEIVRALQRLIASGELPRPRRTIHFLWPQEISGTYAFLKQHPGYADRLSLNLNMDMVGEALRKNNAVLRMSECPGHLPSYADGLARSILEYIWRTNDIVFMSDVVVPPGRPGGQYFSMPLVEKNGSLDAFRFAIQPTMGGTDHVCFINPSVAVPGITFLVWPDQWYHADTDTPDKADPTQLKRAALLGAACTWAAAQCTDEVVGPLADAVAEFGYLRVAGRELPRAMARLETADAKTLAAETAQALCLVSHGAGRELGALRSIEDVFSGSPAVRQALDGKLRQWEAYRAALRAQVTEVAKARAVQLNAGPAVLHGMETPPDELRQKCAKITPRIADAVKGREFELTRWEKYQQCLKERPNALKSLGLTGRQPTTILNYVNGKRSIAEIRDCVAGELDDDVPLRSVAGYLELLEAAGWLADCGKAVTP